MDVILALVQKCRQDRDVASIHDYLGTQNRRQTSNTAPLNQVLTTQQQPTGGDGGSSRRMCYRNYLGVSCKFGNECKHIHAGPNSAARRDFEQNPAEMERYGAWLETFQAARKEAKSPAGSPKGTPPPAAHAASAKSPKKTKKKKGAGAAVNTAAKEAKELAPKLTGNTGSLSVTAPEANVAEVLGYTSFTL